MGFRKEKEGKGFKKQTILRKEEDIMKNLKKIVFSLLAMLVMVTSVNAAEVTTADELQKCLNNGGECIFKSDITVNDTTYGNLYDYEPYVTATKDVTIDLATFKLIFSEDYAFSVDAKNINVILKNGSIEQQSDGNNNAIFVTAGNLKTENLTINVTGAIKGAKGKQVPYAFAVSGTNKNNIATLEVGSDTKINVTNGYGIAVSSFANVTLNGTWNTGKSVVVGMDVTENDTSFAPTKTTNVTFVNGSYTTNEIVVAITKGNWIFNGGTFLSKTDDAINIGAIPKKAENLSIIINDGTFVTENAYHSPVFSSALKGFIYGGTFKAPISGFALNGKEDYIAEGYIYVAENTDTQKVHVIAKPISIIVENVNDPVEKSDLQKTYSYDATGANTKLKQLYSGNTINLDEFLGIRALDNKYYKDYTAIITIKETGEKFYTKLYTNYNAGGMFGSYVIGPDDADNSFVLPKEDVTVTIEFVKTETLKPHKVEVATDITNGSVSVDKTEAKAGETVTVTVKAAEGYKLVKVLVSNGIEVTANEDGTYSFAMPASDVTVSAEFEKVPVNNPTDDGEETDTNKGEENNNNTGSTPADENNSENPSTLDSIVSIVTLAISSLGTAGYSIKKFIRK